MKWKLLIGASVLALSACASAGRSELTATNQAIFPAFSVESEQTAGVKFSFSAAPATSDQPVEISVAGRKLTKDDRKFRTSLQRHWLSVNVPENLEFVGRSLDECGLAREGEFAFCDNYIFSDPATGKFVSFYIYVGNWP